MAVVIGFDERHCQKGIIKSNYGLVGMLGMLLLCCCCVVVVLLSGWTNQF